MKLDYKEITALLNCGGSRLIVRLSTPEQLLAVGLGINIVETLGDVA